ncbi:MAG TPA: inorganic diphosphatase [Albitalea sp.]|uniref:inorganic diphosphatase n=1 Tax=Piscinibacter sp. TaxID=1903157 RepID=UPI002ED67F49
MDVAALDRLPAYADDGALQAVIEACQGSRNKLKYEPAQGVFRLHKVLPEGARFPCDFGFVPSTRGDDGDPLDVLVLMDEPVPAGVVVACRVVGVIEARQKSRGKPALRNDRLLAVAATSWRHGRVRTLADLGDAFVEQVERFFVFYNAAQDIVFEPLARRGPREATRLVRAGMRAFSAGDAS